MPSINSMIPRRTIYKPSSISKIQPYNQYRLYSTDKSPDGPKDPTPTAGLTYTEQFARIRRKSKLFALWAWDSFKKLYKQTKAANVLSRKKKGGEKLSRREYRFLLNNRNDLVQVIPLLLIWKIIPFSGAWLPFLIAMYPRWIPLPSTFDIEDIPWKEKTVKELEKQLEQERVALELKHQKIPVHLDSDLLTTKQKKFLEEKHPEGVNFINREWIIRYSKMLSSIPDADMLPKNNLLVLLGSLGIPCSSYLPIGYLLRKFEEHWKFIMTDDHYLRKESLEDLTPPELISACRERGLVFEQKSHDELVDQLKEWLYLSKYHSFSLKKLLIFSRGLKLSLCLQSKNSEDGS
eukprot:TRINITY_DN9157_c0_g1_i1.p1 TRINITY_DN9157_c0_g1~~TRINITY_DN9157_c0_g1_i1.p1  ORF type:complete len:406 (+),score=69.06 TRINITY_DN9157_c0_g1_i1:173-1219(+)